MWSSFIHAALHYSRLTWDLSPVGQKSQLSVHIAPGTDSNQDSIVLNGWAPQEQDLGCITSQLKEIQHQDEQNLEDGIVDGDSGAWIRQALKGAIAHILEPLHSQSLITGPPVQAQTGSPQLRATTNIIMVLVDPSVTPRAEGEDSEMGEGEYDLQWQYRDLDLRKTLAEALYILQDCIRNTKGVGIHVDFIRISSSRNSCYTDISNEYITRACTASIYNIITADETSTTSALTNHYLLRNKSIQILRLRHLPLNHHQGESEVEIFYRSDHVIAGSKQRKDPTATSEPPHTLETTPKAVHQITELNYGMKCTKVPYVLPTQCAHLASISPSTFVASFFPFVKGAVHLLATPDSKEVASKALFDHAGQLFVHCLQSESDEFVELIVRPNTITHDIDSFVLEGNIFTEIVPPVLVSSRTEDSDQESSAGSRFNTLSTNMALVHTTSRIDLETRWLVQWEGERIHPILPTHNTQIQKFKNAICRTSIDAAGTAAIQSVLDTLISDARPLVLPGESGSTNQGMSAQQQKFRESAQAILADLWMIGQRFKSVSQSHAEAAKLIASKIMPKGLDHQTVKLTLVPPSRRAALANSEAQGGNPIADGDINGDRWGRNKGQRGGENIGSGIGRGGGRGGRFDNSRGGRGGNVGVGGRGRGGFRGGHNNSPGNVGTGAAGDDMNFGNNDLPTGPSSDIMLSMTGKTQPVPYLVTQPPTREETEEAEHRYLAQLGEDGCLLKAYWGSRGAQGSAIASVLNSINSLDSPSAIVRPNSGVGVAGHAMDPITAGAIAAQQKMKKMATKRPRLQDFAGRTPVSENGGYSKN
ncbi:hypothetical protein BGZ76_011089 [Entomortierella beljakovae]|nr:hypothetical protein BGZ76_011089 [Entomortierella beljakovae]